MDKIFLGNR